MNLMSFIDSGIARTGGSEADKAARAAREMWIDKLMVDETRAWMNLNTPDRSPVVGLTLLLTLAATAYAHDKNGLDHPSIRVIRGALSACEQCINGGSVITIEHARSFSAACLHARQVLREVSLDAIKYASVCMNVVSESRGS